MFAFSKMIKVLSAILAIGAFSVLTAQDSVEGIDPRTNTAELAKQLGSRDPLLRQKSAEALARLASTDQRKMVEGYQLEETNKEVKLALDWALYRMGRSEALFRIVHELDSSRYEQAIGYLSELESPDLLYPFFKKEKNPPRVTSGLLRALGRIGNADTLDVIKPYLESLQPYVAEAAETASDEISKRLGQQTVPPTHGRLRTVDKP